MQNIELGKPFEDFIDTLIKAGYYTNPTEVIQDALRDKMQSSSLFGKARLNELIQQGVDDVKAGRVVTHDEHFWERIREGAKKRSENKAPISDHIRP